ncbi:MAG: Uma2 family endonuclease [Bacteroidota bacterium]
MTKAITSPEIQTEVREFLWTIERYHQAIELGVLTENDKVELLFGRLIEKMPVGSPHAACLSKINLFFHKKYMEEYDLRRENPVTLPNASEPEPDYVVAYAKDDFYSEGHPTPPDILLLIEVSESTLYADRNIKASAYALAGIKEYWIINLNNRKIELHLNPDAEEGIYQSINHYDEDSTFASPFVGEVAVADLLI